MLIRSRAKKCFSLKKHLKKQMRGIRDPIVRATNVQSHLELLAKTVQTNRNFRLDLYKVGPDGGINHG